MAEPIRIDCIGDSITSGIKSPSYPRILGQRFKDNNLEPVRVNNHGKNGFTVNQYLKMLQSEPTKSMFQSHNPDIAIILLGTNDTRDTVNTSLDEFHRIYRKLIGIFTAYTNHIFIMNIPAYIAPVQHHWQGELHTFDAVDRIVDELNPALESLVDELGLQLIDIHQPLKQKMEEIYVDGIHPNQTGNKIIAETCYQAVLPTVTYLLENCGGE